MSKFEELREDIRKDLLSSITAKVENYNEVVISLYAKDIARMAKRLESLDETTIRFLMSLTNNYIVAILENKQTLIEDCRVLFEKYGYDIKRFDEIITKISSNSDGKLKEDNKQEQIMRAVYNEFQCPARYSIYSDFERPNDTALPTVKDINELLSKFGINFININQLPLINTTHLDDPYNVGGYFETALKNGLSIPQIIEYRKKIESMLSYYEAPRNKWCFRGGKFAILSAVPFLTRDFAEMSRVRAANSYQIITRQLLTQINQLNSSVNSLDDNIGMHR